MSSSNSAIGKLEECDAEKSGAIPPLLAKRIREYDIPDAPGQAMFHRILIYQIPDDASARETFAEKGRIVMPETTKAVKKDRSPRGVIVSAGLQALDYMRDHGMELGEMVWFSPHVPTRFDVNRLADGRQALFFFMAVSDIIVSQDTPERLASGELTLTYAIGEHGGKHVYLRRDEKPVDRRDVPQFVDGY